MKDPNVVYALFIQEISIALDNQKSISFNDTLEHIEKMTVIPWLKQVLPEFDASEFLNEEYTSFLHKQLENIITCKQGRVWGTENNGLCLLLSATAELIETKEDIIKN